MASTKSKTVHSVRTAFPAPVHSVRDMHVLGHDENCPTCKVNRILHEGLRKTLRQVEYVMKQHERG